MTYKCVSKYKVIVIRFTPKNFIFFGGVLNPFIHLFVLMIKGWQKLFALEYE